MRHDVRLFKCTEINLSDIVSPVLNETYGGSVRVLHVAFSDGLYGADRAAYRIHQSLRAIGVHSEMLVQKGVTGDPSVQVIERMQPWSEHWRRRKARLVRLLYSKGPRWLVGDDPSSHRSLAIFPSTVRAFINRSGCSLVHLHWINGEMMALEDMAQISVPVLWSCHDQWPFIGQRHYDSPSSQPRTVPSVSIDACPQTLLDRWMVARKRKLFQRKSIALVCPTVWIAECARASSVPVSACMVVRLPVDTGQWIAGDVPQRRVPSLPTIAFGAVGGGRDPRKGFDLFVDSLHHLKRLGVTARVILFGDAAGEYPLELPMPVVKLGRLDDAGLREVYASSDMVCVCSRIDNSPMVVLEAMACGTPVVAFAVGGVSELIESGVTGYLVEPFNTQVFAESILQVLKEDSIAMGVRARAMIEREHSPQHTARQLLRHYERWMESSDR